MPSLTTQQKTAVGQFVAFTQSDKKVAERLLKNHNWNLQQAVDGFYASGGQNHSSPTPDRNASALNKLFDRYRDAPQESPDTIGTAGTMNYLRDLSINIEDIGVLVLSELVASPTLGEITRAGFVAGWSGNSATTIAAQRTLLATLISSLPTPAARSTGGLFRRVYKHTFKLACPPGSKNIPLDMSCEYWKLLFGPQGVEWRGRSGKGEWLEWWMGFLDTRWKKAVNRDLWDQTLVFEEKTGEDESLAWWSEDGAWPGVIDEFVEWVKAEKGVAKEAAMEVE